jgi:ribose transport system permease protein
VKSIAPLPGEEIELVSFGWAYLFRRYGVLLALSALIMTMAVASPAFLSASNFVNVLSQWTPVGIMAVGMTYVILAGGFDLSVASGFALCAVVAAALAREGYPPALAFSAAILTGIIIGAFNGLLVVVLEINPFIATLASGFVLSSLPFVIVENPFILVDQEGFDSLGTGAWLGFPYSGMILIGFLVLGGIALAKTPYGQMIYAVGGNPEASRLFGIRVGLISATTYVISGLCMGAAAVVATSQLSYSASEQDPALVFDVIVAVIVGGTSLSGGFGAIWRTAAGLGILATLQNGLNLLGVSTFTQYIVKGIIIVAALGLDVWVRWLGAAGERRAQRIRYRAKAADRERATHSPMSRLPGGHYALFAPPEMPTVVSEEIER